MAFGGFSMILALLIPFLALAIKIGIIVYIYKDAKRSGRDPWLWVLLAIFVPALVTLVIYLIVDDESSRSRTIKCGSCGSIQNTSAQYCSSCGSVLKKDDINVAEKKKGSNIVKLLIGIGILGIVLFILSIYIFTAVSSYEEGPTETIENEIVEEFEEI
jgi:hypothetical protein